MIRGRMSQARLAFEDCHSAAHYLNGTIEGGVRKIPQVYVDVDTSFMEEVRDAREK